MQNDCSKNALIIAPHPDDEINLAGQLSVTLKKQGYKLHVVYTTNGDAEHKINNKRLYEALAACNVLGIPKEQVIFLGYPNEWQNKRHIYNAEPEEILISKLGKQKTNSIPEHPEYCCTRFGTHHDFSRSNFKNDYKDAILQIYPELIVVPDFDSHPDHRAASLLFDEIMGEILKENPEYHPYILKKNIHEGVWYGEKDYYVNPMPPTKTSGPKEYAGGKHELDSPDFRWNERIVVQPDAQTMTALLRDNIIYKAAVQHKVTTAWYEMQRVINGDCVYWVRPTNNLALHAKVEASSGNGQYLNDFKHYDCADVYNGQNGLENQEQFCWCPSEADEKREASIFFEEAAAVALIRVYEDCNAKNHVNKLEVYLDDRFVIGAELEADGAKTDIRLPEPVRCKKITLKIAESSGNPGLAEVEVYSECVPEKKCNLDGDVSAVENQKRFVRVKQKIEKLGLMIGFVIKFKIQYEVKRLLKRS